MTNTLHHRIADACESEQPSIELEKLLAEVKLAAEAARQITLESSRVALDPGTRPEAVAAARVEAEDASFRADRLDNAVEALSRRLDGAVAREKAETAAAELSAAIAERDALRQELADFYPPMAEKLADLLQRIQWNNGKLGGHGVESAVRSAPMDWITNPRSQMPTLVQGVRLPAFELSAHGSGFIWDGMTQR
jgi:hypothetical protein